MGLLKKVFGGEKQTRESAPAQTSWDNLKEAVPYKSPEEQNRDRQQRKIFAAFSACRSGKEVDISVIGQHDVNVTDEQVYDAMSMFSWNRIPGTQIDKFLDSIVGPTQKENGAENVLINMNQQREQKILAYFTGNNNLDTSSLSPDSVRNFMAKFPNPYQFEQASSQFLDMIEKANSKAKRAQYEDAMADFRKKIYGKKQEYWDEIKNIYDKAATNRQSFAEAERSAEWTPGEHGAWQVSRAQAASGVVTRENIDKGLYASKECQDSQYANSMKQVYGVFDGMGGVEGGAKASNLCSDVVRECIDSNMQVNTAKDLALILNYASTRVATEDGAGYTTASLAKVINRGEHSVLAFAQSGDSRIYIVDKDNHARQITRDEGEGRYVTNSIGFVDKNGATKEAQQYGEVPLRAGDRVMICSDGITGDKGTDLMSDGEIGRIFARSWDEQDAAKNLVASARKRDDRTAVVFTPDLNSRY